MIEIKNLVTSFNTEQGRIRAVDDISFSLEKGKTLGIVGESGCGKTVTALSIMRLLPKPSGMIEQGEIIYKNKDICSLDINEMYKIRGTEISMIFQEPMTALNPVHKIKKQLSEIYHLHYPELSSEEIYERSIEILKETGIPEPAERLNEYPHQLSGGMRQRILIAIALACKPELLIADEPTTALDVTIQAQVLDLIKGLQRKKGMSIIFITHDMGVIAEMSDDVVVMYAGKIAEKSSADKLFSNPSHPYTKGLLKSIPRFKTPRKTLLNTIKGVVPSLYDIPPGCPFQNRCPNVMDMCRIEFPEDIEVEKDHFAACYLYKK